MSEETPSPQDTPPEGAPSEDTPAVSTPSEDTPPPPPEAPPALAAAPASGPLPGADKKVLAGILGIILGGFGVHKFILGYTQEGIIQIVITLVTCGVGSIVGLIEGIIYLTKSDEEFVATYVEGRKGWF
ncbi:MAG: TM2 domain-containing protein [Roseibacillus sp.]